MDSLRYALVDSRTERNGTKRVVAAARITPDHARLKVWVTRKLFYRMEGEAAIVLHDLTRFGARKQGGEVDRFPYYTEREAYEAALKLIPCEVLVTAGHYAVVGQSLTKADTVVGCPVSDDAINAGTALPDNRERTTDNALFALSRV